MCKKNKNKSKGNILEQIVADLHKYPDVRVEKNVHIKPIGCAGKPREFDILIHQNVAGYNVVIPIECKNWPDKKIGAPEIDSYVGKLQSVGLPLNPAIYVTSGTYTSGAVERASQCGIILLTLEGLDNEGIEPIILKAFENLCFCACEVKEMSFTVPVSDIKPDGKFNLYDKDGHFICFVVDLIWNSWRKGALNNNIGEYCINIGEDYYFKTMSEQGVLVDIERLEIKLSIFKYFLSNNVNTNLLLLKDKNGVPIKFKFSKISDNLCSSIPIYRIDNEDQLKRIEDSQDGIKIKWEYSLSRIIMGTMYWPPSEEYIKKVNEIPPTEPASRKIVFEPKHIIGSMDDKLDPGWLKHYEEHFKFIDPYFFENNKLKFENRAKE